MRLASTVLSVRAFDRLDDLRIKTGMPSRSALIAELIELGLDLHENPAATIELMIDGLERIYADAAENETRGAA